MKMLSRKGLLQCIAGIMLSGLPIQAYADWESVAFSVGSFNGSGECSCTSSDGKACSEGSWFENAAISFDNGMEEIGYAQTKRWHNQQVDGKDFVDPDLYSYGRDYHDDQGTDFADVIFLSTHGGAKCESPTYRSWWTMGASNTGETCSPRTDQHVQWGDEDANVAMFMACQSAQKCVWENDGYDQIATGSFSTLLGFHGFSWQTDANVSRINNHIVSSENDHIGDNWVDDMTYIHNWSWQDPEQCGVAIVWGSSSSKRDNQYYWGGFKDFNDTGSKTGSTYYYISGCDPEGGVSL